MNSRFSRKMEQLRQEAETRLNEQRENDAVSELELQQTELEIQHEELQRAYNELSQLYEEFWALYEFAPCGYVTLNQNGMITRINQKGIELLGTPPFLANQIGFSRFIAADYQSLFFRALQQGKQSNSKQGLELKLIRSDETQIWVYLDIEPRINDAREVSLWQISLVDISGEKDAAKQREKALRIQLITDSIQGCVAYVDYFQRYQYINKTYEEWLGCKQEEILGKTIEDVIGVESYELIRKPINRVLKGETVTCEAQIDQKDMLMKLVPDWSEAGEVEGFYGLMTDISERKAIERQLIEQEAFLRSIFEGVEQGIFVVDVGEDGVLTWSDFNSMGERIIGCSRITAKEKLLEEVGFTEFRNGFLRHYQECVVSGNSVSYEQCILDEEGNKSCWLMTLTPLNNEIGKVYRIIGTGVNIDERKALELTLREQAEREKLLNTMIRSIRQSLDLEEVATQTVKKLLEEFKVDRVMLVVSEEEKKEFILYRVADQDGVKTDHSSFPEICSFEAAEMLFAEEEKVVVGDVQTESFSVLIQQTMTALSVRSMLAVPIIQDHHLRGVICLQMVDRGRNWTETEQHLLTAVREQLAIALQQAQLYQYLEVELKERRRLENQLRYDALHDQLTGLPNRVLLIDRLEECIQKASSQPFAVFFLDLDRFKAVNDTLGHTAGDQLLIIVSERLKYCLREEDTIVRFGGDEFVILLENVTKQNSIEVAQRIHQTLSTPILLKGTEVTIGTSIGIVFYESRYTDPDPILRDADIAMYEAKNNQLEYVIFNERFN